MRIKNLMAILFLGLEMICNSLWAGDYGTSGARILQQAVGARAMGMAEAYSAIKGDMTSLHYNPGAMTGVSDYEVSLMYIPSFLDIYYGFAGYAQRIGRVVLGTSVTTLQGGSIEINYANDSSKSYQAEQDYLLTLGSGLELSPLVPGLSVGLAGKMITSILLEDYKAQAYALDLGGWYQTPLPGLSVSAVVQNMGSELKYQSHGDPLPLASRLGAAYRLEMGWQELLIASDMVNWKDLRLGIEYTLGNFFFARAGYKADEDLYPYTFGVGFRISTFQVDYALGIRGELGMNHFISLAIKTGQ